MATIDDDVPPLEDMTQEIERLHAIRGIKNVKANQVNSTGTTSVRGKDQVMMNHQAQSAYSGLKKGFLNGGNSARKTSVVATKSTTPATDIPLIKPKQSPTDNLRIDEVQAAMRSQMSLLDRQEWLTPEFLEKIERNPVLTRALTDPVFQKAATELSRDPQAAFKKYAATRPDLMAALREFAGLLGDALGGLADQQEGQKVKESGKEGASGFQIPDELPNHEKELVKRVMADPEVQEALRDPKIQKILMEAQKDPPSLAKALNTANKDVQGKLGCLLKCGLLQIQH
ncbi:hypothetical protein SpCBS45565_g03966 [Spizellomyces sp. 'palustris']|nr:hypothetical protein SpCBS45565_g03966 [Spizellomyces sp. 'palustris']